MFEKIVEMAIHSGLDKIGVEEDEGEKEDPEKEEDEEKKSRHCRVTDFKKPTYSSRSPSFKIVFYHLFSSVHFISISNHNPYVTVQDCGRIHKFFCECSFTTW